jgi:hypothetical protein
MSGTRPNSSFEADGYAAAQFKRLVPMKLSLAVTTIALLVAGMAHGENSLPPPTWPVPHIKPTGTRIQPVTGVTLDSFHVTFEKTTFNDVLGVLGTTPIRHQGDAGEFLMWVCYTLPDVHARVWLTSGELGGQRYIDGMVAKQLKSTEAETSLCPAAIRQITFVSIDNGIWLGQAAEKIKSILGIANKAPASVIYYTYEGKDGEFDVDSVLALKINKNRVTELHANHTSTN